MTIRSSFSKSIDFEAMILQAALAVEKQKDAKEQFEAAITLLKRGEECLNNQNYNDAIDQYRKAVDEIAGLDIFELEALLWGRISFIAFTLIFDLNLALEAFKKLAQVVKDPAGLAAIYNSITTIYLTTNNTTDAHKYSDLSIKEAKKVNEEKLRKELEGGATLNKAEAYSRQEDYTNATNYANKALTMFKDIQHKGGQGKCIAQLGQIASVSQQFQKSIKLLNEALDIFTQIGNQEEIAETKKLLSLPLVGIRNFDGAISQLKEAAAIHRRLGQINFATNALHSAAKIDMIRQKLKEK